MIATRSTAPAPPELLAGVLAEAVADPDSVPRLPAVASGGSVPDELVDLAVMNRVEGSLAVALEANALAVPEILATSREHAALVHLQTSRALRAIGECFHQRRLAWAVGKGPAVARLWPRGPVSRTYDDLDLLVAPGDLRIAAEALEGLGFVHRNRNWAGFVDLGVAEIPFDDGAVVVDLHWNLVALADQRRHLRLDTAAILDRAGRETVSGSDVPVLCDLDAFVHLCCHAGLAGARTMRMLRDVHLAAARVDPHEARHALTYAGCDRLAAPVLDRAVRCFGPVRSSGGPAYDAVRICGHRYWIAANRMVDRFWSAVPRTAHPVPAGALVAAGRPGIAATGAALLEGVAAAARARLGLRTLTSEGGRLHWETGGELDQRAGMERYWAYVSEAV